ncbi:MAG TPA: hypothetical protein VGE29_17160 [Prosthecobacter sp.]
MNDEIELAQLTLMDMLQEAGTPGLVSLGMAVLLGIIGLIGLKRRFQVSGCRAFTFLGLLPLIVGFSGAGTLAAVFRTETGHYKSEALVGFVSSGEVAMPIMVGSFGSCVLMFIASMLWIRLRAESE